MITINLKDLIVLMEMFLTHENGLSSETSIFALESNGLIAKSQFQGHLKEGYVRYFITSKGQDVVRAAFDAADQKRNEK